MGRRPVALVGLVVLVGVVLPVAGGTGGVAFSQQDGDDEVRLPDERGVVVSLNPASRDAVTVFLPSDGTDDPSRRARRLAADADLPVFDLTVREVETRVRTYVDGQLVDGGSYYRTRIETDLERRTGPLRGEISGERLTAVAPAESATYFVRVPTGLTVGSAEATGHSLWTRRYELTATGVRSAGSVTYGMAPAGLAGMGSALVGVSAGAFVLYRRRARSLAGRDAPLEDRVLWLRKSMGNAKLLAPAVPLLAALWFGAVSLVSLVAGGLVPAEPSGAWWTVTRWVVGLAPFVCLPWLGAALATRPVYRDLLGADFDRSEFLRDWTTAVALKLVRYWVGAVALLALAPRIVETPVLGGVAVAGLHLVDRALAPLLIRVFDDVEPVTGDLAGEIADLCDREGVSVRGVYRLDTGDEVLATGLVTGVVGYHWVFLTDDLLDECDRDGIRAVVAHELGHLAHRHLLKRSLFTLVYWAVLFVVYVQFVPNVWTLVAGTALYVHYGIGGVAQRQEYEADAFAASATGADVFVDALERIASVNVVRADTGLGYNLATRYPSFEDRIARLQDDADGTRDGSASTGGPGTDEDRAGQSEGDPASGAGVERATGDGRTTDGDG